MKALTSFFVVAFILVATTTFAQAQTAVYETINFSTAGDGTPYVRLTWEKQTANTAYYLVQKSEDGKVFKNAGVVFSADDASITTYQFRDKSVSNKGKSVFYRIAQVSDHNELTFLPVQKAVSATTDVAVVK